MTSSKRWFLGGLLALLAGCGGGTADIADWFAFLSITSVDAPSSAGSNATLTARAYASASGNTGELHWEWTQTGGDPVSEWQQESTGSSSSQLSFRTPSRAGTLRFQVTVRAGGLADSEELSITIN